MFKEEKENKLLAYFGMDSHSEMMEYIRENPEDEKVKEVKELFKLFIINPQEEVARNEG